MEDLPSKKKRWKKCQAFYEDAIRRYLQNREETAAAAAAAAAKPYSSARMSSDSLDSSSDNVTDTSLWEKTAAPSSTSKADGSHLVAASVTSASKTNGTTSVPRTATATSGVVSDGGGRSSSKQGIPSVIIQHDDPSQQAAAEALAIDTLRMMQDDASKKGTLASESALTSSSGVAIINKDDESSASSSRAAAITNTADSSAVGVSPDKNNKGSFSSSSKASSKSTPLKKRRVENSHHRHHHDGQPKKKKKSNKSSAPPSLTGGDETETGGESEVPTEDMTELERKRLASRISSRRTREREKQRTEYFRAMRTKLEKKNRKLRTQNSHIRRLIKKTAKEIKAAKKAKAKHPLTSFSRLPCEPNNVTETSVAAVKKSMANQPVVAAATTATAATTSTVAATFVAPTASSDPTPILQSHPGEEMQVPSKDQMLMLLLQNLMNASNEDGNTQTHLSALLAMIVAASQQNGNGNQDQTFAIAQQLIVAFLAQQQQQKPSEGSAANMQHIAAMMSASQVGSNNQQSQQGQQQVPSVPKAADHGYQPQGPPQFNLHVASQQQLREEHSQPTGQTSSSMPSPPPQHQMPNAQQLSALLAGNASNSNQMAMFHSTGRQHNDQQTSQTMHQNTSEPQHSSCQGSYLVGSSNSAPSFNAGNGQQLSLQQIQQLAEMMGAQGQQMPPQVQQQLAAMLSMQGTHVSNKQQILPQGTSSSHTHQMPPHGVGVSMKNSNELHTQMINRESQTPAPMTAHGMQSSHHDANARKGAHPSPMAQQTPAGMYSNQPNSSVPSLQQQLPSHIATQMHQLAAKSIMQGKQHLQTQHMQTSVSNGGSQHSNLWKMPGNNATVSHTMSQNAQQVQNTGMNKSNHFSTAAGKQFTLSQRQTITPQQDILAAQKMQMQQFAALMASQGQQQHTQYRTKSS